MMQRRAGPRRILLRHGHHCRRTPSAPHCPRRTPEEAILGRDQWWEAEGEEVAPWVERRIGFEGAIGVPALERIGRTADARSRQAEVVTSAVRDHCRALRAIIAARASDRAAALLIEADLDSLLCD